MTRAVLLWALPDTWLQFETLDPDIDARIEEEMRRRFEGVVDEADLARVVALQRENILTAAEDGIVLVATTAEATSGTGMPPAGLSLTLALANLPGAGTSNPTSAPETPPEQPATGGGSGSAPPFLSETTPLVLEDPDLIAFVSEGHAEVSFAGLETPVTRFQAQTFVVPRDQAGVAVITVTTFDANCEDEARETARSFANTLCFASTDDEGSEAP